MKNLIDSIGFVADNLHNYSNEESTLKFEKEKIKVEISNLLILVDELKASYDGVVKESFLNECKMKYFFENIDRIEQSSLENLVNGNFKI